MDNTLQLWSRTRIDLRFPGSGLLEEMAGSENLGSLGFRAWVGGCEIWHEPHSGLADWAGMIDRVTAQARKAKYRTATMVSSEDLPVELKEAFETKGFTGEPLSRALIFDASDELQPYVDWKGRITQLALGKGSESINAKLYEIVASKFPDEGRFSEVEVNAILKELHLYGDHAGLRRELVDRGYLDRTRDCREYWKIQ